MTDFDKNLTVYEEPKMINVQLTEDQIRFLCRYLSYFQDIYDDPEDFYEDFTEKGCKLNIFECLDVRSVFIRKLYIVEDPQ